MNKTRILVVCLVTGVTGSVAFGQGLSFSPRLGLGAQSGSYSQNVPFFEGGPDDMDLSGLYLSAETVFIDWLATELKLGYNWGKERVSYRNARGDQRSADLHLETVHVDASARPFYAMRDDLHFYGKIGLSLMNRYLSGGGMLITVTDTGLSFVLGAGAAYTHASGFGLHAEMNHYIGNDAEYTMAHIGVHKKF